MADKRPNVPYLLPVIIAFTAIFGDILTVGATSKDPALSYEYLYGEGVKYYLENDWSRCADNLEWALNDWHWWRNGVAMCRRQCYNESSEAVPTQSDLDPDEAFFERAIRNTLCLVRCKKDHLGSAAERNLSPDVDKEFHSQKPYDYLQLCYYRLGQFNDAANAASTVLAKQPGHKVMSDNLKYYIIAGDVEEVNVINLEMPEYGKEYLLGANAYHEGNFADCISFMERSLALFWHSSEDCRALCEAPFDHGWFPDFVSSIANHYTFTLRCKRNCPRQLANLNGEEIDDFLASYFNYLQFSYFKVGNIPKACEAVGSFLTLLPEDASQLRNRQYYQTLDWVTEAHFISRKEVMEYHKREKSEEGLMKFIDTSFLFMSVEEGQVEDKYEAENSLLQETREWKKRAVNQLQSLSVANLHNLRTETDLGGSKRFSVDGFASSLECRIMMELAMMAAVEGDGYQQANSPHTKFESFQGVTLGRIGLMTHSGIISMEVLELTMELADRTRNYLERHFRLSHPLYFAFTHLVCRSAIPELSANRLPSDLSHEVHVDNCILLPSGDCLAIPPAYTFRNYSAVLYLNDDFDGGEFIFTQDRSGATYESLIKPTCGRLTGYSSGPMNPHAVRPVWKGRRCALAVWFTLDRKYAEVERTLAETLLNKMHGSGG